MNKKYAVIDTDIHTEIDNQRLLDFLPEPWRTRYASGNVGARNLGYWNPNGVMRRDTVLPDGTRIEATPQTLSKHFFDAYNIEYGVINPQGGLPISLSPQADYSASIATAINEVVMNDWLPADNRFRASVTVSASDPHLAVKEIHRVGAHPGMVQVLLPSALHMPLGNRYYHPIFEAAVAYNLPIAIHPGPEGTGISGKPTAVGYPSTYLEWHTDLVGSMIAQVVSMVCEGVFAKFPTLKLIIVEGGVSWLPSLMWRFDKNWKALRMTTPWIDRPPSEIIQEHVLLTTQPLEEPDRTRHFHQTLDMFDAGNMLMFSSDYPHWDGDMPDFAANAFPEPMRARVMAENARRVYGLEERQHA
ncbi:MAG: amidohydrolase [Anaerolineaceae bacterium]|nr:amidohydrolase [Anaerolineaceae bacterium]